MPAFAALLRGVNVGNAQRVPMAEFRALLEALGCTDVRTLLNSGNAVFGSRGRSAAAHALAVHAALQARLGLDIRVIVKSSADFLAAVQENTLAAEAPEPARLLVAFAQEPGALQALSALSPLLQARERLVIGRQAAYLHCVGGILESKAADALLGKVGRAVTTRNWATVLKLEALLRDGVT